MLHSNPSRSPYEDGTKPVTVHFHTAGVVGACQTGPLVAAPIVGEPGSYPGESGWRSQMLLRGRSRRPVAAGDAIEQYLQLLDDGALEEQGSGELVNEPFSVVERLC